MNENQIRPETGRVCKFVLAWHKKKTVKAEVCDKGAQKGDRGDVNTV